MRANLNLLAIAIRSSCLRRLQIYMSAATQKVCSILDWSVVLPGNNWLSMEMKLLPFEWRVLPSCFRRMQEYIHYMWFFWEWHCRPTLSGVLASDDARPFEPLMELFRTVFTVVRWGLMLESQALWSLAANLQAALLDIASMILCLRSV